MRSEKISNDELRRDRDRFVAFAFSVADAFVELDAEKSILYAAGSSKSLAGHEAEDLIGRNFLDLIAPDDRAVLMKAHETALRTGRCGPLRLRMRQKDGGKIRLEVRGTNLPDYGNGLFLSFNFDDADGRSATPKAAFKKKIFEANQTIFDESTPADTAYILRSGAVEIRIGTRGDNPCTLTTIQVGDVFGELALLENRCHSAAAIAVEKCETLEIPRKEFVKRLSASDPVMKTVVNHLVRRLRETTTEYEDFRKALWLD